LCELNLGCEVIAALSSRIKRFTATNIGLLLLAPTIVRSTYVVYHLLVPNIHLRVKDCKAQHMCTDHQQHQQICVLVEALCGNIGCGAGHHLTQLLQALGTPVVTIRMSHACMQMSLRVQATQSSREQAFSIRHMVWHYWLITLDMLAISQIFTNKQAKALVRKKGKPARRCILTYIDFLKQTFELASSVPQTVKLCHSSHSSKVRTSNLPLIRLQPQYLRGC
jgi:hypothetical protein